MISVRRITRLLLLVQAAGCAGIALAAWRWFGATPWLAVLEGLAAVVLVRLGINLNNFAMSARCASPVPDDFALGPLGRLRLVGEELAASMLASSWLMAGASARTRIHPAARGRPVLLVHGYGCNSGYWAWLTPLLDEARISHATLDLEPVMGDIDGYVPLVEQAAHALCRESGCARIVVVAHSMGGLVARAWMRSHGSDRVARVITLGTPHHGTSLARMGLGANALQMRHTVGATPPESPWLRALAASETMQTRSLVTSIYSWHDNIVAPQSSSILPGARNIGFGGIGHVALGSNPRVLGEVMREIAAASEEEARRRRP